MWLENTLFFSKFVVEDLFMQMNYPYLILY